MPLHWYKFKTCTSNNSAICARNNSISRNKTLGYRAVAHKHESKYPFVADLRDTKRNTISCKSI